VTTPKQGPPGQRPRRLLAGVITISTPPLYGTTRVRMGSGSGPLGFICAEGTALSVGGVDPQAVRGKVLPFGVEPNDVPEPGAIPGTVRGNNWCIKRGVPSFQDIPGAQAGTAYNPAPNTLAIWVSYGGSPTHWEPTSQDFQGVASTDTECGASADCNPRFLERGQYAYGSVVDTAPLQWLAVVSGLLEGAGAVLNGSWLLTLRPQAELRCLWDNGGDGARVPHVQLCHDGLQPLEWVLTLRHGPHSLRCTRPAHEWNGLGANVLSRPGEADGGRAVSVKVLPV
jgi:hypothetical protein